MTSLNLFETCIQPYKNISTCSQEAQALLESILLKHFHQLNGRNCGASQSNWLNIWPEYTYAMHIVSVRITENRICVSSNKVLFHTFSSKALSNLQKKG